MSINYGKQFEIDFIEALNMKNYENLSENLKNLVKIVFPHICEGEKIYAESCDPYGKPDVKLTFRGESHFISLKTNSSKHVHSEALSLFVDQLNNFGISEETINTIRKYHYGDGTINGNGTTRMTYDELFPTMINEIKKANEELNFYNDRMVNIVEKFVFIGNDENKEQADFIYHGSLNFGVICSRKQVVKHLRKRNYDYMRNPHIGPLQFHPYARYASFKERSPYKREIINFIWINFISDLEYISQHYSFY